MRRVNDDAARAPVNAAARGGNELVSHADAAAAFDIDLRYAKQGSMSTPADLLFLRRWRNIASSNRFSSLKQLKLTDMTNRLQN
jgi:hypothetical protein